NARRLSQLAGLADDDGAHQGEVSMKDLDAALNLPGLSSQDRRAVEWMKRNMSAMANEDDLLCDDSWIMSGLQAVGLSSERGISSQELTDFAKSEGATYDSAQQAAGHMPRDGRQGVRANLPDGETSPFGEQASIGDRNFTLYPNGDMTYQ